MSPKRCLAVKKRGVLKEPLKNISPKLSLRQLSEVLRDGTDDGWGPDKLKRELRKQVDRHTPLGPLLVELRVPLIDGPDLRPHKLLFLEHTRCNPRIHRIVV